MQLRCLPPPAEVRGWRADGGLFPSHERTTGSGDGNVEVDEEEVTRLLEQRSLARKDQVKGGLGLGLEARRARRLVRPGA